MTEATNPLEQFAAAAADYRAWCRSEPGSALVEAHAAIRHLARLVHLALPLRRLPHDDVSDGPDDQDDADWKAVYGRMAALPVAYDWESGGDIGDDLADIDRDLGRGLRLHAASHRDAAEWEWAFHFNHHWGQHATDALNVLHRHLADHGGPCADP